jgi:deoxyxylulose-5-phosphate synthase
MGNLNDNLPLDINAAMPWTIEPNGSSVHVHITAPMDEPEWESLLDALTTLDPQPVAIRLPSRFEGQTQADARMLEAVWVVLRSRQIAILPASD